MKIVIGCCMRSYPIYARRYIYVPLEGEKFKLLQFCLKGWGSNTLPLK